MSKSCFVAEIKKDQVDKLKQDLQDQGFEIKSGPHLLFHASKKGIQVHLYMSLKLTVMGKDKDEFILFYLEPEILQSTCYSHPKAELDMTPHMGSDEAGKGDYFGPLCVVACSCSSQIIEKLFELGVQDSKNLSDQKIFELADKLKTFVPHEKVVIYPKTYNELYDKFKNLNRLLAWAHTKAITGVYQRYPESVCIVDQFSKDKLVEKSVNSSLPKLQIIERTKAESDLVVAAASILAREAFLTGLKKLSEKAAFDLPKGAASIVVKKAKELVEKSGRQILPSVAKMHFKTSLEI